MKLAPFDNRNALPAPRTIVVLAIVTLLPLLLYGSAPAWWSQRGVLTENAPADDYVPITQGQLKNLAKAAIGELDAKLDGGAGDELHQLIQSWSSVSPATNDFAPVNLGQLKSIARPVYDRLITAGLAEFHPWLESPSAANDFAVANVGQAKNLFSFDIPPLNVLRDEFGDRLTAGQDAGNLAIEEHAVWMWADPLSNGPAPAYPRRISGLPSVRSVSAGEEHLTLLAADRSVWTWGENSAGQLGDGTNKSRTVPAPVPGLVDVVSVKAGGLHTLVLKDDGTVVAWGENYYGQLGTGDTTSQSLPVLTVLDNVRKIAAGYQRSVALKNDGTVWVWGYDHFAWQIEQDLFHTTPVPIGDLTDVIDIAAGYEHNVVVKSDGTVWVWGSNYANQLGNGSSTSAFQAMPVQVPGLANIVKVASGYDHTLALASDGTVWSWGYNSRGQLGDGSSQSRLFPVRVTALTDVIAIATAYSYSLAMKSDGTVWSWGDGATGTLPGTNKRLPQQVGIGLLDTNDNRMDDRWELQYFGDLTQAAGADPDRDGISNLKEYIKGTNPTDYFNGERPTLEIVGGDNQIGEPGSFLAKPLTVRIRNAAGQSLKDAPVLFVASDGSGGLALVPSGPPQPILNARADLNGEAKIYRSLPQTPGVSVRTTVSAGDNASFTSIAFRSITKFSLPPAPIPASTPPNGTPTPAPSATPAAAPPYRYAIIDLGKNLRPTRVANNGSVLLYGTSTDQWGYFRWKSGVLEQLTYGGNAYSLEAGDMNDDGVAVGVFYPPVPWVNNQENEVEAGLVWNTDSAAPTKVSAPVTVPNLGAPPGSARQAAFTAINNQGEIFGRVRTGVVKGWHDSNNVPVLNSYFWPHNLGAPAPLSYATARMESFGSSTSLWDGSSDTVLRASSSGHYIGRKFTPIPVMFGSLQGAVTGMIDGQTVLFWPADINEAGIVVGSAGADMVVHVSPTSQVTISGASPLAINDHTYPAPSPQPSPIPAPQILSWAGNATVLWERQENGIWHPFGLEEMIPSMDGWQSLEPCDMNDTGAIVGRAWYKDPANPNAQGAWHGFMLVPIELMVDGNRDGEMSFADPVVHDGDQTSEDKPYQFWVNDDQDARSGTTEAEEITPPSVPDSRDERIQNARDCEDLARLRLNVGGLIGGFKAGVLKFVLKFRNVKSGNPAIRAFRSVENGGRGYVTNEAWASLQAIPPYNKALPGVGAAAVASPTSGVYIDRQFWEGIDESDATINLLFEGVEEGEGELYLDVVKDGRIIGSSVGVWVDIVNINKMYERVKTQPENIVAPYTVSEPFTGPVNFVSDPNGHAFRKPWNETDQCVIFVHGWNVSYQEYLGVAQTMFKRLWHQGFKGHFASFRWDTRKSDGMFDTGEYNRSENRAYVYAGALKQWATDLSNTYTVNIIAHSMGNVLCGEALRQGLQVRNYLLMEAALPMSCYAPDADRLPRLEEQERNHPTPDYHRNPTTNESAFGYRAYISSVAANLINFFNPDDWALATGTTEIIPGLPHFETNWERNQINYKPDGAIPGVIHAGTWRYLYDGSNPSSVPLGRRALVDSVISRHVIDSWEMKAFVARSRTKAVGAFPNGSPVFFQNIDLSASPYNFGRERSDHSGQFTRDIQRVDALYNALREALDQ